MCSFEVIGIGSAWVDRIYHCSDAYIRSIGLEPGQMYKVDSERYRDLSQDKLDVFQYAGGSVASSLVALSQLSHHVGFVGKASADGDGLFFMNDLISNGVSMRLTPSDEDLSTSGCLYYRSGGDSITKVVHLGVSKTLGLADMSMQDVINAKVLLVEADILDMPKLHEWLASVLDMARKNETKVVLVLSNKYVVSRHRQSLLDLLSGVDFIAGNEVEFEVLLNTQTVENIVSYFSHLPVMGIMTRSCQGSCAFLSNDVFVAEAYPCQLVDTVSAGDYYLSGFLHAHLKGLSLQQAVDLGSVLASKVCSQMGGRCCDMHGLSEIARSFVLE